MCIGVEEREYAVVPSDVWECLVEFLRTRKGYIQDDLEDFGQLKLALEWVEALE